MMAAIEQTVGEALKELSFSILGSRGYKSIRSMKGFKKLEKFELDLDVFQCDRGCDEERKERKGRITKRSTLQRCLD
jgi:hypothetical protein